MKKTLFPAIGLAILMTAGFALALAADVTGDWDITMKSPRGERTSTYTFEQKGEALTFQTTGRNGEEITGNGTVKGNEIEWSITRSTPQGEFTMTYKGTIDGDKMSGTVEMREGMSFEWSAVRKPKSALSS